MLETAKENGVNLSHCLVFLLEEFPSSLMNDRELEKLAPWNEDVKADLLKSVEAAISAKRF